MLEAPDFLVSNLGEPGCDSPYCNSGAAHFVGEGDRILYQPEVRPGTVLRPDLSFEKAGARRRLFFEPSTVRAAIVTCGGLCPGLNNVIRSLVMQLHFGYNVRHILGIRYGYRGMMPGADPAPMTLTPAVVSDIHKSGGTVLGSSRGPCDIRLTIDNLEALGVNVLFAIGGDGTQRGAYAMSEEARRRGLPLAIVGIPKTIDNDIPYVYRTFGYMTAIAKATEVIDSAHNEARGQKRGVGLVKLMGRHAGFIAVGATLASGEVNFTLIPEVPFTLDGTGGLYDTLDRRLGVRGHAVIVVAEGAGQSLLGAGTLGRDASGNLKLGDVGIFLSESIRHHFTSMNRRVELKYIDPSYYIRSAPANTYDAGLCDQFARCAVHAAMAGKTDMAIGMWHSVITHVPFKMIFEGTRRVREDSEMWQAMLKVTGQPGRLYGSAL